MLNMSNTTLVYCIEGKDGKFESDARVCMESFRLFHTIENVVMMQPSDNDIDDNCKEYFKEIGVKYFKKVLHNPQSDNSEVAENYTNVPLVCDYMAKRVETDYMLFTDLDVVYFDKLHLPETDKCILTIIKGEDTDQWNG